MTATEPKQETNPLLEGLQLRRMPDPCALVIFGASGDLTRRKLFPALYSLALRRLLPEKFAVVGVARSEESDDEFRERMKHAVQEFGRDEFKEDVWDWLAEGMRYVATDFSAQSELVGAGWLRQPDIRVSDAPRGCQAWVPSLRSWGGLTAPASAKGGLAIGLPPDSWLPVGRLVTSADGG